MKKLLYILLLAGILMSCGSDDESPIKPEDKDKEEETLGSLEAIFFGGSYVGYDNVNIMLNKDLDSELHSEGTVRKISEPNSEKTYTIWGNGTLTKKQTLVDGGVTEDIYVSVVINPTNTVHEVTSTMPWVASDDNSEYPSLKLTYTVDGKNVIFYGEQGSTEILSVTDSEVELRLLGTVRLAKDETGDLDIKTLTSFNATVIVKKNL